jgi:hypothetical protein
MSGHCRARGGRLFYAARASRPRTRRSSGLAEPVGDATSTVLIHRDVRVACSGLASGLHSGELRLEPCTTSRCGDTFSGATLIARYKHCRFAD